MSMSSTLTCAAVFPKSTCACSERTISITSSSLAPTSRFHVGSNMAPCRTVSCRRPRTNGFTGGAMMSMVDLEPSSVVKSKAAEVSKALKGTSIFLVGINGSMKTSAGKILADALRYYYFDSDSIVVEASRGRFSDKKSFLLDDEQGFRDSETEVLKQLSSMVRLVVCAGDGAVQGSTNLAYLRHGISIWIDVPLDILANEILNNGDEYPILKTTSPADSYDEILDALAKQYMEAKKGFATADAVVSLQGVASGLGHELENVTPEDMALEVLNQIEKLIRMKKMLEDAARPF